MTMTKQWMTSKIRQKIPATIATGHVCTLTITITKKCGGTPVTFASAMINLEHKQDTLEIHKIKCFLEWVENQ